MPKLGPELLEIVEEAKRRFADTSRPTSSGIRDWLARGGQYYVSSAQRRSLSIVALDDSWRFANGSDAARFFLAARESVVPRSDVLYDPRSIGWSAVSMYYTGFYLLLGFMRLFGHGIVFLSRSDCAALGAAAGGVDLERGAYSVTIQLAQRPTLVLARKESGGFHETFWRHTDDVLRSISGDIAENDGPYRAFSDDVRQRALLDLEDSRVLLGGNDPLGRKVGWMSSVRNDVQYRLGGNGWAPRYLESGVPVSKLRQDVLGLLRGKRPTIAPGISVDPEIRAMFQRVSEMYREIAKVSGFPKLS